jgi:hypothetical protein
MKALPPDERKARKAARDKAYRIAHRAEQSARYQSHKDEILAQKASEYAADPEKFRARSRAWYQAHRDHCLAYLETHREERRVKKAVYNEAHREEIRAYTAANSGQHRAWLEAHRDEQRVYAATYRATHSEYFKAAECRRREAPFRWRRMEPWPQECQICGGPIDVVLCYPDPGFGSIGHEPPVAWMLRHQDYSGPLVLRPEHFQCNRRKRDRPDWELS